MHKQEFLNEKDNQILIDTLVEFDVDPQEYYRFWDYALIQLDGDFSLQEMKALTEAMSRIERQHNVSD